MRNVWKGLVVGGLTGVGAGVVLDSLSRASKKAAEIGTRVRDHAPEAGRWVHSLADRAGETVHDADVPGHVRDAAHRIAESDSAHRAAQMGSDVASAAKEAASSRTS